MATTSRLPSEVTPAELARLWKKSGQFDRLRKQLLSDFLASADHEALVAKLDSLVPTLIERSDPPLSRIPRKDRPPVLVADLDRAHVLESALERVKQRLERKGAKGSKGIGRTVERELRGCLSDARGLERSQEEPDSEEGEEEGEEDDDEVSHRPTQEAPQEVRKLDEPDSSGPRADSPRAPEVQPTSEPSHPSSGQHPSAVQEAVVGTQAHESTTGSEASVPLVTNEEPGAPTSGPSDAAREDVEMVADEPDPTPPSATCA
ncbi:hypothetical protein JCM10212_006068 [Sporobolomyces blumeae]